MADGEVLINTKINTEGAKEDLKKLKKELTDAAQTASDSAQDIEQSFDDVDLSNAAEGMGESFEKETAQAEKAVEDMAEKLPESYRTIYEKIEKIRSDDTLDSQQKVDKIRDQYVMLGQDQERALAHAWDAIKHDSDVGSRRVIENLEDIAEEAEDTATAMATLAAMSAGSGGGAMMSGMSGGGTMAGIMGGIAGALTQKAMDLLADAGRALVEFGKESIELGSDLQEVQNVVDVTFTNMSDKVDEFAKNAAQSAGLSETMAKKYTGTFGAMAKSFGFTEQEAYDMATSLTQLTGDVASFYNLDHDEAYTKLKGVFTGETEALKELGVVMTQSALDQYALEKGIGKTTAKMSEQEKVALRHSFVMEQLEGASGDFVRTQDSWANQTRILSLQWESFQATIGEGLIAMLTPGIQFLTGTVMPALNEFADFLTSGLDNQSADDLTASFEAMGISMEETIVKADGTEASQQDLKAAIDNTAAAVEKLKQEYDAARDAAKQSIDSQIGLLTELETKSDKTAKEIVDNWKAQQAALNNYADNMKKAIDMGLDEALVKQLSDGSQESMLILEELVNGTGTNVAEINQAFHGVEEAKETVASVMADVETDFTAKLETMARDNEEEWDDMADVVNQAIRDMQQDIDSLQGKTVYVDVVERTTTTGSTTTTLPSLPPSTFPWLAEGAVIPPNAPFTAVLGDQRNGYNLEGPEDMFRQIVREETQNTGNEETNALLRNLIAVVSSMDIDGQLIFDTYNTKAEQWAVIRGEA